MSAAPISFQSAASASEAVSARAVFAYSARIAVLSVIGSLRARSARCSGETSCCR